jgi:outer membrane protein
LFSLGRSPRKDFRGFRSKQRLASLKECGHTPGIPKEFSIQMKRTLALATLLASSFALHAVAQTPAASAPAASAPAGPAKVAVIMFQAAVMQTNEGQRNFADVQRKFGPKRDQIKTLGDEVDNLKKQLQAQADKLTPAESASRTKTIDDKTKQAQRLMEDAQTDYNTALQEMFQSLSQKVFEVVDTYAKQQGYTLVLDASQQQSPILWAADATNITKEVVDAYNAKSGVPAPPPSADLPSAPKAPASSTKPAAPKK